MGFLIEALWLGVEVVLQAFVNGGFEGLSDFLEVVPDNRALAALGYAALGFVLGALASLLLPRPLLPPPATRGVSLAVSPLASGLAMHVWGSTRARGPHGLATFWGGASFAFGCALGRFLTVAGALTATRTLW
jgi:hypothetical protein